MATCFDEAWMYTVSILRIQEFVLRIRDYTNQIIVFEDGIGTRKILLDWNGFGFLEIEFLGSEGEIFKAPWCLNISIRGFVNPT